MRTLFLIASICIASLNSAEVAAAPREMHVEATAYCVRGFTKSGAPVRPGIVAADPVVLPLGSVLQIAGGQGARRGIYRVLDQGPAIKGRAIDIFMPSCRDAMRFGRRQVLVRILRLAKAIVPR